MTATYYSKNEIAFVREDMEVLQQEMKAGFAEMKSELKTEINKLKIWIVATFLAGGSMIVIAKLFFSK